MPTDNINEAVARWAGLWTGNEKCQGCMWDRTDKVPDPTKWFPVAPGGTYHHMEHPLPCPLITLDPWFGRLVEWLFNHEFYFRPEMSASSRLPWYLIVEHPLQEITIKTRIHYNNLRRALVEACFEIARKES